MANWQRRQHINDQVLDFYHSHARFPKEELDEVNRYLEPFLNSLQFALQNKGICAKFKDTGSAFEKVHEPHLDGSLELDIEAVMDGSGLKTIHLDMPSSSVLCAQKKRWCDALPSSFFDYRARVSTRKVLDIFEGACTSVAPPTASFQQHGPAITMKVMRPRSWRLWFAVDIVPAISIQSRGVYVPKQRAEGYMKDFAWRESFSLEERENYPSDCPWAKPCLRMLKALCDRHDDLGQLQSYPLKNLPSGSCNRSLMPLGTRNMSGVESGGCFDVWRGALVKASCLNTSIKT